MCIAPTLPRNLSYDDLTQNSVAVMWQRPDPPNGLIQLYTVRTIKYSTDEYSKYIILIVLVMYTGVI